MNLKKISRKRVKMSEQVKVSESEKVCVCVYVCERERERKSVIKTYEKTYILYYK